MAQDNPLWGEERITSVLLVNLGMRVSPEAVRTYMPKLPAGQPRGDQRGTTFPKNHAKAILACDFFIAVTATFRMLYVLVVTEHGRRKLKRVAVTAHANADRTLQQLREVVGEDSSHRYLLDNRDSIFAERMDASIKGLGLCVPKSPPRSPNINAICKRATGTLQRECLDWLIPMTEAHLREILKICVEHNNGGRRNSSLGSGLPGSPHAIVAIKKPSNCGHRLGAGVAVHSRSALGGLRHEYSLVPAVALPIVETQNTSWRRYLRSTAP